MKIKLIIFLFVYISTQSFAQHLDWAKSMGGTGAYDYGQSIVTDANGNVYVTGFFEGTVDFDPGVGIFNLVSNGIDDIFIQKLDANGNFIWAKSMGGTDRDYGNDIAIDANGNAYITGFFEGTVDFDPGAGTFNLTSDGSYSDVFILKLNPNGDFLWSKRVGSYDDDSGYSIALDDNNNVYVTGEFENTVDFNPNSGTFNLSSTGYQDIFILKLNSSGTFIWAKSMEGTISTNEGPRDMAIDVNNDIYISGHFQNTVDFNPNSGTFNLTSNGGSDIFILKLNSSGSLVWAKSMGGTGADYGYGITTDVNGNVYTTGVFRNTVNFNPNGGSTYFTSNGVGNTFVQKLSSTGAFIWAKNIGGSGSYYISGHSIVTDTSGNVYTTGAFRGTIDFDPNTNVFNLSSNGGNIDVFITKLTPNGDFVNTLQMGGVGGDKGESIHVNLNNDIYTTGNFTNTVDFDPNTAVFNLTSNGGSTDIFIQKLRQCSPNTGTDTQIACNAYTWIDGITYTTNNNTATDTITNMAGCDSIVTLDLTILGASLLPYQEDFTGTFPPLTTAVLNPDNARTWEGGILTATNGSTDDVMYIEYSAYNAAGQKDYFTLPLLDLDTATVAELSFDMSYNPYSALYSDTLAVEISTDCGLSYQPIYTKGGLDLSIDNNYVTAVWIPGNAGDWRKERIDLTPYLGNTVLVRFVGINGYGNNLYLDNINVGLPIMTNIKEVRKVDIAKIYPTPTKDYLTLELSENSEDIELQIVDVNGRVVLSQEHQMKEQIQLSVEHLITGIYFVKIESNKGSQVLKMVKE